eukprot:gene2402-6915_t
MADYSPALRLDAGADGAPRTEEQFKAAYGDSAYVAKWEDSVPASNYER